MSEEATEEEMEALMGGGSDTMDAMKEAVSKPMQPAPLDDNLSQTVRDLKSEAKEDRELEALKEDPPAEELTDEFVARCAELEFKFKSAKLVWEGNDGKGGAKAQLKKMIKKGDRGLIQFGKNALEINEVAGSPKTDYKEFIADEMGDGAVGEAQSSEKYTKMGKSYITVKIKRLGSVDEGK